MRKLVKKPDTVGAWRITEYSRSTVSDPWRFGKRWLYDSEKKYKQQLKSKVTTVVKWSRVTSWNLDEKTRLTVEKFDGNSWVQILEWIGPNDAQRLARGIK